MKVEGIYAKKKVEGIYAKKKVEGIYAKKKPDGDKNSIERCFNKTRFPKGGAFMRIEIFNPML